MGAAGGGGTAVRPVRPVRPVDVLDRGPAVAALVLVGGLSLVLHNGVDRGVASLLWQHRHTVAFLWDWRLASLAAAALLYLLSDGAVSLRRPERSSRPWMVKLSVAWLVLLCIGTFGFHGGTMQYRNLSHAVSAVLVGVLAEELVFRGAVFGIAERVRPAGDRLWSSFPVVVSTVLFALGHLQGYGFDVGDAFDARGYVWTNGLVYGVLRLRSRSIWPPLAVHSVGNALALVAGSI